MKREKRQRRLPAGREIKKSYYLIYSLLFFCIAGVILLVFQVSGKSFIWAKDGLAQHYPSLVYIHDYLTEFFGNLFQGRWQLPMVDYSIGEGMDILTTLNYYGFGDPLTLLSVFCPREHLEVLYGILIFIRLYLSGLFFSWFCFAKGHRREQPAVLCGALAYTFCGFALYAAVRHPFFVNGMVYLPLYLLGVEHIWQKRRYDLFSAAVALSLLSNFYFAYMNTIMAIFYVLFHTIPDREHGAAEKWKQLFKMAGAYLRGVAMSGAVMLPMVMAYLGCSRGGEGGYSESLLFYPGEFYRNFILAYACPSADIGEWTNLGYTVFCLISVVLLFCRKEPRKALRLRNRKLKLAWGLLTLMMLIPLAGKVMNGFGYVSNRWNYAYAMLNAYILVCMLPVFLRHLEAAVRRKSFGRRKKAVRTAVCILLVFNLMTNAVILYSNNLYYYLGEFEKSGEVEEALEDTPVKALKDASLTTDSAEGSSEETDFYRVEQPWTIGNQSLAMGYYGHNWYFSIAPEHYFEYYNSFLLNSMERTYSLRGLDGRTVLNELAANKYYVTSRSEDGLIPYGYQLKDVVESEGETNYIYENQYFLPLGYTVSAWVKRSEYDLLSPVEQQEVLMQSVVLEDEDEEEISLLPSQPASMNLGCEEEFCRVVRCDGITWEKNRLSVNRKNATIELSFSGRENCETYLWFNKFQVIEGGSSYQTGTVESDDTLNHFVLMNPRKSSWYDEPDQTINLGYSRKPRTSCVITFPEKGVYSLDNFMVIYEPMDNYKAQVDALKSDVLENLQISANTIQGEITLSKTKLLQLAVPYSKGWTAWVDGEKAELYRSNLMYMALALPAGEHQITLRYETPYLKAGLLVSLVGIFVPSAVGFVWRRRRKRRLAG